MDSRQILRPLTARNVETIKADLLWGNNGRKCSNSTHLVDVLYRAEQIELFTVRAFCRVPYRILESRK